MSKCPACHREVRNPERGAWAKRLREAEAKLFHTACLRHRMSRDTLAQVQKEASARVSWLMKDWRLVLGKWMALGGYPYREFYDCPVCDGHLAADSFIPALKCWIGEVDGVTVSAYYCPVCNYFLPELPEEGLDEEVTFETQWEAIKQIVDV